MNEKNAIVQANNQKLMNLRQLLENRKKSMAAVMPAHLTPERLIRISLVAASRNPMLLQCTPESIFSSLMDASQLGLEPFTGLNMAYIIPYKNNKTGMREAKFMPSYLGLVELARRSGLIKSLSAEVVNERDTWEVEKGLNPKLVHVPIYDGKDPGKAVLVYAIAHFRDGGYQFEVMSTADVEYIRSKSQSGGSGPWVDHWDAMAKKTVVKRLLKLCPLSTELSRALAKDNACESGVDDIDVENAEIPETVDVSTMPASKMDALTEKLENITSV